MINERMLELILLNQLDQCMNNLSTDEFEEFCRRYNIAKIEERSKELTDEFLSKYAMD